MAQEKVFGGTGESPYSRSRIDSLTECRCLEKNNSSKKLSKLRILKYFFKSPGNIPGFLGRSQGIPRDELLLPRDLGFFMYPITANSFISIFAIMDNL